jgi:hypothetical protein
MVNRGEAKAPTRSREHTLKTKLSSFYASRLESKLARSFTDDADVRHGRGSVLCQQFRPGQRDDELSCGLRTMLTVL